MSSYRLYQEARDTAWRALLQLPVQELPVDVDALAGKTGVEIHPFPDPREEERLAALAEKCGPGAAVSLKIQNAWHIFVRPGLDEARRRFAVAHEIGHILLCHPTAALSPGVRRFTDAKNEGDLMDGTEGTPDYGADIFAIRLLAPACLLHELHIDTPAGIAALCGLPPYAAAFRAGRMETLNQRNFFYKNPLERKVRDRFLPYLNARRAPAPARTIPPGLPERKRTGKTAVPYPVPARTPPAPRRKRFFPPRWARYAAAAVLALIAVIVCRIIWG